MHAVVRDFICNRLATLSAHARKCLIWTASSTNSGAAMALYGGSFSERLEFLPHLHIIVRRQL